MSEGTIRLISEIHQRIRVLARRMTFGRLLYGLALFLGFACGVVILAVGLEAVLWMATTARTIIFWILAASAAGAALILLGPPLLSLVGLRPGPDDETVAKAVGQRFPEVSDRLLDLLQLAGGRRTEAPEPLVDAAVAQLGQKVRNVDYRKVERFDDFRRAGRFARWPLIGLVAFVLIVPGTFGSAAKRIMAPGTIFLRPAPFEIVVEPGDVRLVRGDSLVIESRLIGNHTPDRISLAITRVGENRTETVSIESGDDGDFSYLIPSIRNGFQYRVEAGEVTSPTYRVDVSGRPFVRSMQMTVTPPSYTGQAARRLAPDVGDVSAILGSTIEITLDLGGEGVGTGQIVFDESSPISLEVDGGTATASFRVVQDDRYRVALLSSSGVANERPIDYRIRAIRDQRPSIFVLSPSPSSEFEDDLDVDISARITDDFGFSGLFLYYRLAESRFGNPQETFSRLSLPRPATRVLDQQMDYGWELSEAGMDLVPGDVITFYLEVADNDAVSGYKTAASGLHTIRFPSLTDRFEAVEEQQDDVERALENLLKESDEVKQSFDDLRKELQQKQEGDWNDERMVERLKERQSQLDDQVSDLAEKMESLVDEMSDDQLLSPETLQKFSELKRVVEEISSPELQEALERLREAMMELDLTEMQRSLGDFEFNEEQFRDRIERALELFKRLRTEQQLEEAARRADDLSKREAEMAEQTAELMKDDQADEEADQAQEDDSDSDRSEGKEEDRAAQTEDRPPGDESGEQGKPDAAEADSGSSQSPDPEQLAGEQERAAEDMKRLEELMQEISRQMQELAPAPTEEMQQALDQLEQQDMQNEMRRNAEDLRKNEFSQAQQSQQQMQQNLQQLSQQLGEMQEQMSGRQLAANLQALRRTLDDVLTLSLEEERLRDDVRNLASREAGLRDYTQQQAELLNGLEVVGDTLSKLSRSIPQMSRRMQTHAGAASMDMSRAVEEMTDRRGQQAMGHQKSAMTNLNELALLLSDLMANMQGSQSGMAGMSMQQMMQQLQDMAGQQGRLNEQIQQFLNDMQGSRLSQDMQARLQQMAAQQQALQKQLDEMSKNSDGAAERLLGDLEQIARQMEETVSEMQKRQIDRKTYERQQEILTRLLDAQRSMRERGKDNKRQGRSADEIERSSPSELTPDERAERLRRELLRALEAGYSPDYEELIRRYFEALQQGGDAQ